MRARLYTRVVLLRAIGAYMQYFQTLSDRFILSLIKILK